MSGFGKSLLRWLLLLFCLGAAYAAWTFWYWDYRDFLDKPLAVDGQKTIDIRPGTSYLKIVEQLRREGVSDAPDIYWRALSWQMDVADRLQAGEYAVEKGMVPRELLARIAQGKVKQYYFTIIEGWTFKDLRLALARETPLVQTVQAKSEPEIAAALGEAASPLEGRFLPETYAYVRGDQDMGLLKRSFSAMRKTLDSAWPKRPADSPLKTPEEMLVLASIVEKETGRADERPKIAGVFIRRLRLGMKLQTDPTVIYGLGAQYDGNLRRRDLETDTPYNTYTRLGLPPTPIAMPGKSAIAATIAPDGSNAIYFVARGDGSHEFSADYASHQRAVAKYQLGR